MQFSTPKTCIIYHYHESNLTYRDNLAHFIRFGLHPDNHYIFLISEKCSLTLPAGENMEVIHVPNGGYDYGGYARLLTPRSLEQEFEHFIFVNSSVRGPFFPSYFDKNWARLFTEKLSDETRLVGSTINILPEDAFHAQDYRNA